jgi:Spy/CpxP family protein refolding chaperone
MKRTLITFLILAVATAAIAAPPPGRPGRGPQGIGPGPDGPGPRHGGAMSPAVLAEFLGLTDAQIAQVEALREQQEATIRPLREQMRANHEAIEEALASGNSARSGELMLASYNLRTQIKAAHDSYKTSFEALLTAEQKAKWAVYVELMELRKERRD